MNPSNGEKAGWLVAAGGWLIAGFRYVFSYGSLVTDVRTVKDEVKDMKTTLNKHGETLGNIQGQLERMNGTGKRH